MDSENPNIVKLSMEHSDIVYEYMKTEFAPDEPLLRTCDGMNGTSFSDKMVQAELREKFINKGLQTGDCFGIFDNDKNLIGVRLGFISDKQNLPWEPRITWILSLPRFMTSKKFRRILHVQKFSEELEYKLVNGFDQCQNNNGKIYFCMALGVARKYRGQGIGGKLLKRSIEHAKERGCSHMYAMATGKYSQKIFHNYGFEVIKEKNYDSYYDEDGNIVIQDEIHKSAQTLALKIDYGDREQDW